MGIKNLFKFLREKCPQVFEPIHISEYAFRKVAIDTSLYVNLFMASYGDKWLYHFVRLIECLRKNEIHCVFIYDTSSPPEKQAERKRRRAEEQKMRDRVAGLLQAQEEYEQTGVITPVLQAFIVRRKIPKRIMFGKETTDMEAVRRAIEKMVKHTYEITEEDFVHSRELLDILDVPYVMAPMEAETTCADLCRQGQVDAVLTRDSDVLAYGSPVLLTKIDTQSGMCQKVVYNKLLEYLSFTDSQFLDFCIMCGTDYNKNIFKIGPKKSFGYITTYDNIETIEEETKLDTSILNHRRTRELFRDFEKVDLNVKFCGFPDFKKLAVFFFKHNIKVPIDDLVKSFTHVDLVFEGEEEKEEKEEKITK